MKENKNITVQLDKVAKKIYVSGMLPDTTLCLYNIQGKVLDIRQVKQDNYSFDFPPCGEYVLVATHALSVPVVKQFVIE